MPWGLGPSPRYCTPSRVPPLTDAGEIDPPPGAGMRVAFGVLRTREGPRRCCDGLVGVWAGRGEAFSGRRRAAAGCMASDLRCWLKESSSLGFRHASFSEALFSRQSPYATCCPPQTSADTCAGQVPILALTQRLSPQRPVTLADVAPQPPHDARGNPPPGQGMQASGTPVLISRLPPLQLRFLRVGGCGTPAGSRFLLCAGTGIHHFGM